MNGHRDPSDDPSFYNPELCAPAHSFGVAVSHDCDACGRHVADPDQMLCEDCTDQEEGYPPRCTNPKSHEWIHDEDADRVYCLFCGADGDA